MAAEIPKWDLSLIKLDLLHISRECTHRGLEFSGKWADELKFSLSHIEVNSIDALKLDESPEFIKELDKYDLAKRYFNLREYDRAAYFTERSTSNRNKFIHWYSKYLSGEKKKIDDVVDSIVFSVPNDVIKNQALKALREDLHKEYVQDQLDGFSLFLYGVVLKKLDLKSQALDILQKAIHKEPLLWGAWLELATLIVDKDTLHSLALPDVWVKQFFLAHAYVELQLNEEALQIYNALRDYGFSNCTYIMAQIAIAFHNMRDIDLAVEAFQHLRETDPYRLDNMDTYSNLLYVKEMRVELSYLAHHTCDIDKYRVETCCVTGNYYSLRSQHEKAVLYFQRALKLNPNYLSAWTLMGHEYMEMKNTAAAIQSYRQAIEVNQRDYRAWYGLGQTYEILKMHYYCLYYYRQAQQLRYCVILIMNKFWFEICCVFIGQTIRVCLWRWEKLMKN
ncbi:Anaphase-promoting complex subunit 23, variant 2 [Chamberlinius hualienensis]